MVVLSGGEPTIRPELGLWARRVAALRRSPASTERRGGGARAWGVLVPAAARCAARAAAPPGRALALRGAARELSFAHDGLPLCLLPGLEELYDDLKTHRFATMIEA